MRILALTPYPSWPLEHGGRIRNFHLLSALAREHEVFNVTGVSRHDADDVLDALGEAGIRSEGAPLDPPAGPLSLRDRCRKLAALARGRTSLIQRFFGAALADLVARRLEETWDAVWIDQIWMSAYLEDPLPAPLVHASHNVESMMLARRAAAMAPGPGRWMTAREAAGLRRAETELLRRAALNVATSEDDKLAFLALAPDALVKVVPNGVDLATRPLLPAPEPRPTRLLYVGGYDYPPNLDAARRLAGDVLPRLRRGEPDAEVHLVGRDPSGALAGWAAPGLVVHGRVEDLVELYGHVTALVVPMTFGGGSRLKIIEAWALGRPVIASEVGASGLGAEPGRHYLRAETPEEVVEAVGLLHDDDTRSALVAAGRSKAERDHDWSRLGERFRILMESALAP